MKKKYVKIDIQTVDIKLLIDTTNTQLINDLIQGLMGIPHINRALPAMPIITKKKEGKIL